MAKKGFFEEMSSEVGKLVDEKQLAYGDSFGKMEEVLKIICPDGVTPDKYGDLLAVVRMLDKIFRIMTNKDAFDEDPFADMVGYSLLCMRNMRQKKKEGDKNE